jgi:G3E family GTPase
MTKIDIVSGFLGAGKTTLIKKLLAEAYKGEKLVLIENEFGEINIDGGFLKESGIQISEMSAGCICCSLVGDFNKALKDVEAQFHPDRILIEPSGVGKLSDVIVAVENTVKDVPEMKLNSFVTVADATKVKVYMKNFGEFYNNQIEAAGTIILSRTQKMTQEKLEAAVSMLREKNADAAIITTPWDELDGKAILSAIEKVSLADELLEKMRAEHEADEHEHHHHHHDGEECDDPNCSCHHHDHEHEEHEHEHHHHHHADEVFTSWGKETPKVYTQADIDRILTALDSGDYGAILRAKGIVNGTDGAWIEFDYVPEEHEIRAGHPDYTGRLCVIGSNLKEEKLAELFGL